MEKAKHDMQKRQRWKDQETKLTGLHKKYKSDDRKGNLDSIVTQEDMAKLAKFAKNGRTREIAMIKDKAGNLANGPDEAVENIAEAHFEGSKVITESDIKGISTKLT